MPTLEEMLADAQLTDDIKIALPGGKEVTVKDLRAYAASQRDASSRAQTEYLEAKRKAEKLATDSLALYNEAERLKAEALTTRPAPKEGDIDWDTDPVYAPVNKRFLKEREDIVKALSGIEELKKGLAAGFNFVTQDYYERRWNAIPKDQRPKDKSWRDYMDAAKTGNIKDSFGLDDPIEAYNRATAAERDAARLEDARKKGIEEGKKLAASATLPRPGSTPALRKSSDAAPFKSLREAMDAAQHDPEILRVASGEPS